MPHRIVLTALSVVFVATLLHGDCPGSSLQPRDVDRMLRARHVEELDAAFEQVDTSDAALSALYRRRRLSMNPTRTEEIRYLKSLPATREQLDRVYELSYTADVCEDPTISATVYDMFDTAAHLMRKHGILHRRLIELCLFSNAEVGEVAWPVFDPLLEDDAVLTVAALRELPREVRVQVCGGADPKRLSLHQAVRQCQSGL